MKITCKTEQTLPITDIVPFQGNLKRRGKKDIDKIILSIQKYGFSFPFFVFKKNEGGKTVNYCLDGHGRLEALARIAQSEQDSGETLPPLPVVYIDAKDDEEAKQKLLRLNSQYGTITQEGFTEFIKGIDVDLSELKLDSIKIETDDPEAADMQALKEKAFTREGDLYTIGRHKLLCGNSSDPDSYKRLLGQERADLIFTDPPYGVNYSEKINKVWHKNKERNNNYIELDYNKDKLYEQLKIIFQNVYDYTKDGAAFYITFGSETINILKSALYNTNFTLGQTCIWAKNRPSFSMGRTDYSYQHEIIQYGWKKIRHFYGNGKYLNSVWQIDILQKQKYHPTMKPVGMIENCIDNSLPPPEPTSESAIGKAANAIDNSTRTQDIVLDVFGGSGTTLLAAQARGRSARLIEIAPAYCDAIVRRAFDTYPEITVSVTHIDGTTEIITRQSANIGQQAAEGGDF